MRKPDLEFDGWCLEDGEAHYRAAPDTFWIPELEKRQDLVTGDYAKLIFRISLEDDPNGRSSIERMWVVVRERIDGGYLGVLDNKPDAIEENDELWLGTELPFAPGHVIDIEPGDEKSRTLAAANPRRRWS